MRLFEPRCHVLSRRPTLLAIAVVIAGCTSTGAPSSTVETSLSPATATQAAPSGDASSAEPAASLAVSAVIPLDTQIINMAAGADGVWLLSPTGVVLRVDPATNAVVARIEIPPSEFGAIAIGSGSVWVTDFDHDTLHRIDPKTNKVVASVKVGTNPEGLLVTPGVV